MKSTAGPTIILSLLVLSGCERQQDTARASLTESQAIESAKGAAQESFSRLSTELKDAIDAGGPGSAVEVCSKRAPAILAEVSAETGLGITRISDKPRNPDHAATDSDLVAIGDFRKVLAGDGPGEPQVTPQSDGSMTVRLPIVISSPLCLQCHGSESEIADETRAAIAASYPGDQAIGYQLGDLRGIWRIDVPVAK